MRLSEQGGRSVSETVRGLLLNQAAPEAAGAPGAFKTNLQRLTYAAGGAVLGAAIASGLFLGLAAAKTKPTGCHLGVLVLEANDQEHRADAASTVVTLDHMAKTQLRLPTSGADGYQVNVDIKRQPSAARSPSRRSLPPARGRPP